MKKKFFVCETKREIFERNSTIARAHIYIERPKFEIKTNFFHSELILKTTRKKEQQRRRKRRISTTTKDRLMIHCSNRNVFSLSNLSHHLEEEGSKVSLLLNYCQHDCPVDLSIVVLNIHPPKHRYRRID